MAPTMSPAMPSSLPSFFDFFSSPGLAFLFIAFFLIPFFSTFPIPLSFLRVGPVQLVYILPSFFSPLPSLDPQKFFERPAKKSIFITNPHSPLRPLSLTPYLLSKNKKHNSLSKSW